MSKNTMNKKHFWFIKKFRGRKGQKRIMRKKRTKCIYEQKKKSSNNQQ